MKHHARGVPTLHLPIPIIQAQDQLVDPYDLITNLHTFKLFKVKQKIAQPLTT